MTSPKTYYIIGSLRNPEIPLIAKHLTEHGISVFSSWYAAGPSADDCLRDYEKSRGLTYREALADYAAQHIFKFDKYHLDRCDGAILVYPAGKSCHLELGYMIGREKPSYIYMTEEPERYDIMLNFAKAICYSLEELVTQL